MENKEDVSRDSIRNLIASISKVIYDYLIISCRGKGYKLITRTYLF